MKLNWATGIILAFIGFIGFILYFVISASTNSKYHHDLVTPNYYEAELNYQNDIDQEKRTITKGFSPKINISKQGLELVFPKTVNDKTTGTVRFYRPSNKRLDFEIPLQLTDSKMMISKDRLLQGRWDLKVTWQTNNTPYLFKESLELL